MTGGEKRETRIIRCPACQRYYRITTGPPAPGTRLRCSKCGEVFSLAAAAAGAEAGAAAPAPKPAAVSPATGRGRVLVSTDGADFQSLIGEVLTAAGYSLRHARSGEEAWAAIGSWRPHVALLDVALPGVPAFELCDRVRADKGLHGTGLILIASVFQQTRYKRAPTSLYGADDYIEKHHIRDRLPDKVAQLLPAGAAHAAPPAGGPAAAPPAAEKRHCRQRRARAGDPDPRGTVRVPGSGAQRAGKPAGAPAALRPHHRLRHRPVQSGTRGAGDPRGHLHRTAEEGDRGGSPALPGPRSRVDRGEDYYHEAVRDFIAKRTGAHGGGASRPRGKA